MPTPSPETLVTVSAIEKLGRKIRFQRFAIAQLLHVFWPHKPFVDGLLFDPRKFNPRPVIPDFDVDLPAFLIGAKCQSSF